MNSREEYIYHNTELLLKNYRDVVWSLEVSVFQTNMNFMEEYGCSLEEFLDMSYEAGMDVKLSDVASRIESMNRSRNMLRIIDHAITILREKHKKGEEYYWILYYTYLSPQELKNTMEIVEKITPYIKTTSRRTYFRKKEEAVMQLGYLLWGYTAKETEKISAEISKKLLD